MSSCPDMSAGTSLWDHVIDLGSDLTRIPTFGIGWKERGIRVEAADVVSRKTVGEDDGSALEGF